MFITDFCFYCGKKMNRTGNSPHRRTVDHVIPKCRRATHPDVNDKKVLCCSECNRDKGSLTLEEYRVVLSYRVNHVKGDYVFPGDGGSHRFYK